MERDVCHSLIGIVCVRFSWMSCFFKRCVNPTANITSPPYTIDMASLSPSSTPSKKDHELFIIPKKRIKTPFTRSRNKSYQQATGALAMDGDKAGADFIPQDTFEKCNNEQKLTTIITSLNKLHNKLDNINVDLYKEKDGLWPRVEVAEDSIDTVLDQNAALKFEFSIMKGVIQKQEQQIGQLMEKVNDLTARQMSDNIMISGLVCPDPNLDSEATTDKEGETDGKTKKEEENCSATVKKFFEEMIGIKVNEEHILVAHRIGHKDPEKEQLMVVRCHPKLKEKVL